MLAPDVGDIGRAAFGIADIQSLDIDRRAEAFEEGLGLQQPLLVAAKNGEAGAEASKQAGDRKPEAAAGPGDDDDLALEQVGPVDGRHGAKLGLRQAVVRCAFPGHGVGLSWRVDGGAHHIPPQPRCPCAKHPAGCGQGDEGPRSGCRPRPPGAEAGPRGHFAMQEPLGGARRGGLGAVATHEHERDCPRKAARFRGQVTRPIDAFRRRGWRGATAATSPSSTARGWGTSARSVSAAADLSSGPRRHQADRRGSCELGPGQRRRQQVPIALARTAASRSGVTQQANVRAVDESLPRCSISSPPSGARL